MDSLHLHMANVFDELTEICQNAESAVGEILHHPNKTTDQSLIALQGLDRLRQSLEDMSRLSNFLSKQQNINVPIASIRKQIVLTGLFTRLIDKPENKRVSIASEYDELWEGNLFPE